MRLNGKPETLDVLRCFARGEQPSDAFPEWPKVVMRLSERLCGRGLIDCGTSPTHGWITDDGREHLRRLADVLGEARLRELASSVADAYERGDPTTLSWWPLSWPRRHGKRRFLEFLDNEMRERGWTVTEPGVYHPPEA